MSDKPLKASHDDSGGRRKVRSFFEPPQPEKPSEDTVYLDVSKSDHYCGPGERPEEVAAFKEQVIEAIQNRAVEISQSQEKILLAQVDGLPSGGAQGDNLYKGNFARHFEVAGGLEYSIPLIQAGILALHTHNGRVYFLGENGEIDPEKVANLAENFRGTVDFLKKEHPDQEVGTKPIQYVFLVDQEVEDFYDPAEVIGAMRRSSGEGIGRSSRSSRSERTFIRNANLTLKQLDLINRNLSVGWLRRKLANFFS